MEEMRMQINLLKEKINDQKIVSDSLMRNAMQ